MTYRAPRLFVIKFLGLWTSTNQSSTNVAPREADIKDGDQKPTDRLGLVIEQKQSPCQHSYEQAVKKSTEKINGFMLVKGVPGMTISVSKQKEVLWKEAFGYCDVENQVPCHPDALMRIASMSKSLFAATVVAPMVEEGKLDLNWSIHKFLTEEEFPKQKYKGEEHDITFERLLAHTSGVKHYNRSLGEPQLRPIGSKKSNKVYQDDEQYNRGGYYQRKTYRNVIEALEPIRDGPLTAEPGKFSYTTYGFTLLSAAVQKIHQLEESSKSEQIEDFWLKTLRQKWKLNNTYLDYDEVIIPKRARYYLRNSFNGGLTNAPYTDNSIKWAGGGLVSNCDDMTKFANALIDSYKGRESSHLKRETLQTFWKNRTKNYALGFSAEKTDDHEKCYIYHTGLALGASSVLLIYPDSEIVVVILTNLGLIDLKPIALSIADFFENVEEYAMNSKRE